METQLSKPERLSRQAGFSLFEMLITIAILGILASIALTSFSQGKRDIVVETIRRRNAQSFASIAECAQLSGVDPVQGTDVVSSMRAIVAGVTATSGVMKGHTFRIFGINEDDLAGISAYMTIRNGNLIYEADKPIVTH